MPRTATKNPASTKITPLWIVAAFVTLTEAVLGIALTRVTGGVQIALTSFVIAFALLVAAAFFLILWNRPYVFYPPSEYAGTDPKGFIDAIKGGLPESFASQVRDAEAKPLDAAAKFKLIDSLMDDGIRQHLILMYDKSIEIPFSIPMEASAFQTGKQDRSWIKGGISAAEIRRKLNGTELVEVNQVGPSIKLSDFGRNYAKWLVANGKKNDYYKSAFGGWGIVQTPTGFERPANGNTATTVEVRSESSEAAH